MVERQLLELLTEINHSRVYGLVTQCGAGNVTVIAELEYKRTVAAYRGDQSLQKGIRAGIALKMDSLILWS